MIRNYAKVCVINLIAAILMAKGSRVLEKKGNEKGIENCVQPP